MARKNEAALHLSNGLLLEQIATEMAISMASVIQYLSTTIGEGQINRSDLLFSIPKEKRLFYEQLIQRVGSTRSSELRYRSCKEGRNLDGERALLELYLSLRDARIVMGDMYEALRSIELSLHACIGSRLKQEFGEDWWRKGVPQAVRKICVMAKEDDPEPIKDPFCYTTFIHLKAIIEDQWNILADIFPRELSTNKRTLMSNMNRLNQIRNGVMHPVKGIALTEDDFEFVHDFHRRLGKTEKTENTRKSTRGIPMSEFMK